MNPTLRLLDFKVVNKKNWKLKDGNKDTREMHSPCSKLQLQYFPFGNCLCRDWDGTQKYLGFTQY